MVRLSYPDAAWAAWDGLWGGWLRLCRYRRSRCCSVWAYAAYKSPCTGVSPAEWGPCLERNGLNPLLLFPVGGVIAVWFLVDLAVLLLGLWLLQRRSARRGAAWSPGALRLSATLSGAALAVHMLLGYWWVMAYTQGPRQGPGECPACFRLALRGENALEAVHPGVVFLILAGVDCALVWFGIWLVRRRRGVSAVPAFITEPW